MRGGFQLILVLILLSGWPAGSLRAAGTPKSAVALPLKVSTRVETAKGGRPFRFQDDRRADAGLVDLSASEPAVEAALDPVVIPGGVADPSGKTGYVVGFAGGLDALDLATGKVLWTTREHARPLIAFRNRVVVQNGTGSSIRLVVLNAADKGKVVRQSKALAFPDWVIVQPQPGHTFTEQVRLHGGDLFLKWQAGAYYFGGAAPTPEIEKAARKNASGVIGMNLQTGKITTPAADTFPAAGQAPRPAKALRVYKLVMKPGDRRGAVFHTRRFLQALDAGTGKELWQHRLEDDVRYPQPP